MRRTKCCSVCTCRRRLKTGLKEAQSSVDRELGAGRSFERECEWRKDWGTWKLGDLTEVQAQ